MFSLKKTTIMSTSPYSQDLRNKVINYLLQGNSQRQASKVFSIHENTLNRWWVRYKKEGNCQARERLGRPSKVDQFKFEQAVKSNPNTSPKELGSQFKISAWHACRILKKLGFSYKKKSFTYLEAKQDKREEYLAKLRSIPQEKRVYIDESGIEEHIIKEKAWGKKGARIVGKKNGKRYKRTNIVAGYVNKDCIAPFTFRDKCNSKVFNQWIEEKLVPKLEQGQVVIMDNAKFHKDEKTRKLIKRAKCELLYLPAYSPDLNPIERYWSKMKRWLRENREKFDSLLDAINCFLIAI